VSSSDAVAADAELRALLIQLKTIRGLTYEQLGDAARLSHGAARNYLAKAGHRRHTQTLQLLLVALGASRQDRARAAALHRRTQPGAVDPAEVGWAQRARSADCTVWTMAEFSVSDATVHAALGRRIYQQGHQSQDLAPPVYVPRAHDAALRRDIQHALAGKLRGLIVVRGTSSTGKTRSLFEAVHALCADWTVIRPRTVAAAGGLPDSGVFDRPVVVWLNELQGFLGPTGVGLSIDVLRDLSWIRGRTALVIGV
jgi:hypothetical protein